jgi:hypothetical protein
MSVSFVRLAFARRNTLAVCLFAAMTAGASAAPRGDMGSKNPKRQWFDALIQTPAHPIWDRSFFGSAGTAKTNPIHSTGNVVSVTSCADDGSDGTLRKAIEGAADGDTIDMSDLQCSLITLQSGELVTAVANLTIQGPGVDALTIDGNNAGRVLQGMNLDISDVTIAHGVLLSYLGGGCIYADGDLSLTRTKVSACLSIAGTSSTTGGATIVLGNLTMLDAVMVDNMASALIYAGGGGALVIGSATLYHSTVSGNTTEAQQSGAFGGGLMVYGDVALHGSIVEGNTVRSIYGRVYGGGIHAQGGAYISILDSSTITGNTAHSDTNWSYGGGISSGVYGYAIATAVTVDHGTISGNTADSKCASCFVSGGGIHAFDSIDVTYSTISDNDATCQRPMSTCTAAGGGLSSLAAQSLSNVSLHNATVSTNRAVGGAQAPAFGIGGGVWVGSDKQLIAHNSTIAFNHASHQGGGIVATSPANNPSEMISTIVSNNDAIGGADDISPGPFAMSATISGSNNLVTTSSPNVALPGDTLTADPQLLPLTTTDGGLTAIHPLAPNSVAINTGNNPDSLGCDQRGYPYRRVQGAAADIGAYEAQGETHLFADNFDGSPACPPAP